MKHALILLLTILGLESLHGALTITGSAAQLGDGTNTNNSASVTDDCANSSTHTIQTTVTNATGTSGAHFWNGAISTPGDNSGFRFRSNEQATIGGAANDPPNVIPGADPTLPGFIGNMSTTMTVTFPLAAIGTGIDGIVFDHSQAPTSTSDSIIWSISWTYGAGGATGGTTATVSNPASTTNPGDGSQLYDFTTDTLVGASYTSGTEFYLDFDGVRNTNSQVRKGDWTLALPDNVATLTVTVRALDEAYTSNIGNEEIFANFTNAGYHTLNGCVDGVAIPEPSSLYLGILSLASFCLHRKRSLHSS